MGQYESTKSSARIRGLAFELTEDEFYQIVNQKCSYGRGKWPKVNVGLDRKDNAQGYTLINSVSCCARHNRIKSDVFSYEEMIRLVHSRYPGVKPCGNTTGGRKKTHTIGQRCVKGHELTEANVYRHQAGRIECRQCSIDRGRAWNLAKRTALRATPTD